MRAASVKLDAWLNYVASCCPALRDIALCCVPSAGLCASCVVLQPRGIVASACELADKKVATTTCAKRETRIRIRKELAKYSN